MSITNETYITILNENNGKIYSESLTRPYGYVYASACDGIPSETPITFAEFKYINSKSAIFKDGLLRIEPSIEDEVFKAVGTFKKSVNFLLNDEIKDIVLNPTVEKLQKIINITSAITIDKVRNMLIELNNSDEYYIASNVFDLVNARYRELYKGKIKSDIILKKKKNEPIEPTKENEKEADNEDIESNNDTEKPKKAGRPKTK